MSLESTLNKLVAAIEANTAAITAASEIAPASAPTTAEPPKPKSDPAEPAPEPSTDEKKADKKASSVDKKALTAKVIELAKAKGRDTASKLLAEYGATKVPEVKEDDYDAVFAKAEELLA